MEFKQAVVTQNGRALMAKLLAGKSTQFTKIKVSSTVYQDGQLENLTALTNIEQETTAQAYGNNTATVSVVGAIENTGLQKGYYINTVGLYAVDPDKGEILYSVSSASVNGYMPPDTGVSKSGFEFKIYTEVGNATKVDLTVDPAAYATHEDIERLEVHQAWATGENGEGLTNVKPGINLAVGGKEEKKLVFSGSNTNWGTPYEIKLPTPLKKGDVVTLSLEFSGGGQIYQSAAGLTISESIASKTKTTLLKTRTLTEDMTYVNFYNIRASKDTEIESALTLSKIKIEIGNNVDPTYTPAPQEDPINCYPKYVFFGIKNSDNYQDYRWILNPDWVNANAIYGTEITTLKDQLADIQDWIQAHS